MGIESTMTALTEALNNHTKALEAFVKAGAKGGSASTGTKTESAGTKPADKPAGTKPGTKAKKITQEMVQTKFGDFLKIGVHTINGACARNKGMALFPRRIGGHYVMCSRIDGENCYGLAKKRMLDSWVRASGLLGRHGHVRFYSDHVSDEPGFEWADEAIAVARGPRSAPWRASSRAAASRTTCGNGPVPRGWR
mgnify:CR=1 FL=1